MAQSTHAILVRPVLLFFSLHKKSTNDFLLTGIESGTIPSGAAADALPENREIFLMESEHFAPSEIIER
jgi:hypothetical protein